MADSKTLAIPMPDMRGTLVKKAETAARRYFDPPWVGRVPYASSILRRERNAGMGGEYMLHGRMANSRRFMVYASALEKWANRDDSYRDCPVMKSKPGKAIMGRIFKALESKFGARAQEVALGFCSAAEASFGKDYFNAPSKPERLLKEVLKFHKVRDWLTGKAGQDLNDLSISELNMLHADIHGKASGRSSPLLKALIAKDAQALLDRVDDKIGAQKISW